MERPTSWALSIEPFALELSLDLLPFKTPPF
jgi:hypothetical protein